MGLMIRALFPPAALAVVLAATSAGLMRLGYHLWTTNPAGGTR